MDRSVARYIIGAGTVPFVEVRSRFLVMSAFLLAAMQLSPDAVLVFGVIFVVVSLGAWWVKSRRRPAKRLPSQTDVDDFARIFRL